MTEEENWVERKKMATALRILNLAEKHLQLFSRIPKILSLKQRSKQRKFKGRGKKNKYKKMKQFQNTVDNFLSVN